MTPIYIESPEGIPDFADLTPPTPSPRLAALIGVPSRQGEIPWIRRTEARQECFMSYAPRTYTYGSGRGVRTYESVPMTLPIMKMARFTLPRMLDCANELNVCFLNRYADQHQHLGWHADDDPGTDHDCPIVVVSYYERPLVDAREIWIRPNGHTGPIPPEWRQSLAHRSVFVMPPGMQQTHQHRIPKHDRECGARVSLTFRRMR